MPWGIGALVGGADIISGLIGSGASSSAAKKQAEAEQAATAAELQMYNQTVGREQPFVTAGTNALQQLQALLGTPGGQGTPTSPILAMLGIGPGGATGGGINPATFQGSPGYQYALQQGTNAVTNANAPSGIGGNALRALQQAGQGLANQNWSQYLGNANTAWQGLVNNIQNLVSGGSNAAANLGGIATKVGGEIGGNAIGAGNALASGTMGSANALAGGLTGAGNSLLTSYLLSNATGGGGVNPIAGIGNLLSGYNWNGMAGPAMLSGLSTDAAANAANGFAY